MKDINDLIPDIQAVLNSPQGEEAAKEIALEIAANVGFRMGRALNRVDRARKPGVLFPSELGHPCDRKIAYEFWYSASTMKPVEELTPNTRLKFAYGDIIESLVIPLAKASGHTVELVDQTVEWSAPGMGDWKVRGRVDMAVDGHMMDVKSMAARSYDRWAQLGAAADGFGYSAQVAAYQYAYPDYNDKGFIFAIDKEGGKMQLVPIASVNVASLALNKARAARTDPLYLPQLPTVPDGKSGNMKLCMTCSYCKYRDECWKAANGGRGLRTFWYSFGPVHLVEVAREPKVAEAT